jgi:hypothetical protein
MHEKYFYTPKNPSLHSGFDQCSLTLGISFLFADYQSVSVLLHVSSANEGQE